MSKGRPEDVLDYLKDYCRANGWPTTEMDIRETLACEDEIWRGNVENEDHFVHYDAVVKVAGQYIKYSDARAKDNSEHDFEMSSIHFVEKTVITITSYK